MADFIFIRHAESTNNHLAATGFPMKEDRPKFLKVRKPNPELTEDGRAQTELVARRIIEEYYALNNNSTANNSTNSDVLSTTKKNGEASREARDEEGSTVFTPRPVTEIWCSYLTRAIETAVAIQSAIKEHIEKRDKCSTTGQNGTNENTNNNNNNNNARSQYLVPPIRMDSDATEVGGHYVYDASSDRQVGTPGFTNKDVRERWPDAVFIFPQVVNEDEGWYQSKVQEDHHAATIRAERFVKKMESVAEAGHSSLPSSLSSTDDSLRRSFPPLYIVITHGDFFRTFLQAIASNTEGEERVVGNASSGLLLSKGVASGHSSPSSSTTQGETHMSTTAAPTTSAVAHCTLFTRVCDAAIKSRASVKRNVGNTSLSHFRVRAVETDGGVNNNTNTGNTNTNDTTCETRTCTKRVEFSWVSAFMADNSHVTRDASQAAAVSRFETKGKDDFEDTDTK